MICYLCKRDVTTLFDDGICLQCRNGLRYRNE